MATGAPANCTECRGLQFASFHKVTASGSMTTNNTNLLMLTPPEGFTSFTASGDVCLTRAVVPDTITTLLLGAFQNTPLRHIEIQEGVTTISNSTFAYSQLETIILPSTVTSFGNNVFYASTELYLEYIVIKATTPPTISSTTFANSNNCIIYVPDSAVNTYKAANNWSALASRIKGVSERPT